MQSHVSSLEDVFVGLQVFPTLTKGRQKVTILSVFMYGPSSYLKAHLPCIHTTTFYQYVLFPTRFRGSMVANAASLVLYPPPVFL